MTPRLLILAAALVAVLTPMGATSAMAQGRPGSDRAGPTIADTGSAFYRFERLAVVSADGRRAYRIHVGVPRRAAPAAGYPVAYLLDGDAALAQLDEAVLARLNGGDPPVIVAVGYEGEGRFDVLARAFDYTPKPPQGDMAPDPAGRPGGGADDFLRLLRTQVAPLVEAKAPIDRRRSLLWGHSYGGLCVLHAALTQPATYGAFVAASPSVWWNYGSVLAEVEPFLNAPRPAGWSLTVMVGEGEVFSRTAGRRRHPMWDSVAPGAVRDMVGRLAGAGAAARYVERAGQGHGGMLAASLTATLLDFAGADSAPPAALS